MLVSCTLFIRKYANNPESRFSRLANNAQRIMSVAGLEPMTTRSLATALPYRS